MSSLVLGKLVALQLLSYRCIVTISVLFKTIRHNKKGSLTDFAVYVFKDMMQRKYSKLVPLSSLINMKI